MSPWPATSSTILGIQEGRGRGVTGYHQPAANWPWYLLLTSKFKIFSTMQKHSRWDGRGVPGYQPQTDPACCLLSTPNIVLYLKWKKKNQTENILRKINGRMECLIFLCNIWKIETEHWMNGRFVLDKREVVLGSSHRRYIGQFLIFFWNIWNKTRDQCKLSARDKSWDGALGAGWKNIGQFLQCRLFYDWPLFCGEINSVLSFLKDYKKLLKLKCFLKYEI